MQTLGRKLISSTPYEKMGLCTGSTSLIATSCVRDLTRIAGLCRVRGVVSTDIALLKGGSWKQTNGQVAEIPIYHARFLRG